MSNTNSEDQSRWEPVKAIMADAAPVRLGPMHSFHARNSPRRLLYTTSYYKFAAKMIRANSGGPTSGGSRVLDIGCGEGIGTYLVAKECGYARGVDFDDASIDTAHANWTGDEIDFACVDFLQEPPGGYDAVINFDVIEHIQPGNAANFIKGMADNLGADGIAVVGTPNETTRPYASAVTNAGHVNLYSGERLHAEMSEHFTQVLLFGANDEVVHTGFPPMCHYLIAVGVRPRRGG